MTGFCEHQRIHGDRVSRITPSRTIRMPNEYLVLSVRAYIRKATMICPDEHVGDYHFLRDDRAVPVYDAGRLVALALGAAVACAGGVDHRDGSSPSITFGTCSMLRGHRGSG